MHIITKNKLFIIFILALLLRIYKLGIFPYGFHVDEVKAGWNAVSILETLRDDHLNFLPLYYNSFGDFRPTGIIYSIIPSILLFGKSVFAVRFSSALFGALTTIPLYFITKKIYKSENASTFSAILLALSPWHMQVSRATSEVVISTFLALSAIYYLIRLVEIKKTKYLFICITLITLSYLFYHSIRLLAPLMFLAVIIYYKKLNKLIAISLIYTVVISVIFTLTSPGLKRLSQVSIANDIDIKYEIEKSSSNKLFIYSKHVALNYLDYFSGNFLIGDIAKPYRYVTPGFGLLGFVEYGLIIIGVFAIIRKRPNYLPLILLTLSPLPAILTSEDTPNLHRAFLMLPFLAMIGGYGISYVSKFRNILILALFINFIYFLNIYFNTYSQRPYIKDFFIDSPTYRNVGTIEIANKLDDLKKNYDKVIITNFPDSPYPWYAFLTDKYAGIFNKNYSPLTNERIYGNIVFSEQKCPADTGLITYNHQNVLFIEPWECPFEAQMSGGYPLKIVDEIRRPDGSLIYVLLARDPNKPLIVDGKEIK